MVLLYEYVLFSSVPPSSSVQWNSTIPAIYPGSNDSVDTEISYSRRSLSFGEITNLSGSFTISDVSLKVYSINSTTGNVTITLPLAINYPNQSFHFRKIASANTVTIVGNGEQLIDGGANVILTLINEVCTLTSDGASLWSSDPALVSNYDTANEDPSGTLASTINHNLLANLTSGDPHVQYTPIAGRSGGMTIAGSPVAGEGLSLRANGSNLLGSILFLGTTASTSSVTGSVIISGGVGIAGAVNIAGSLTSGNVRLNGSSINTTSGSLSIDAANGTVTSDSKFFFTNEDPTSIDITSGVRIGGILNVATINTSITDIIIEPGATYKVRFPSTVPSFTPNDGAVVISGGVGIGGTVNIAGPIFAGNIEINYADLNTVASNDILKLYGLNGVTTASPMTITNTTASVSTTTGALVVTGGVGIGGALFVASLSSGNVTVGPDGIANTTQVLTLSGVNSVSVTNSTASTSVGTGALIVAGGVGVAGRVSAGSVYSGIIDINGTTAGSLTSSGILTLTGTSGVTSGSIVTLTNNTVSSNISTGALVVTGGVGISGNVFVGNNVSLGGNFNHTGSSMLINGGTSVLTTGATGIVINANNVAAAAGVLTLRGNPTTAAGNVNIVCSAASISTTTGALLVAGGVGVVGRVTCENLVAGEIGVNSTANQITCNTTPFSITSTIATGVINLQCTGATSGTVNIIASGAGAINFTTVTGTANFAAATRVIVNNVSAASTTAGASAFNVVGGAQFQGSIIVGNATNNITYSNVSVTSNGALTLASTGANGVTINSGNNVITTGNIIINTSTSSITGNGLIINATNAITGGTLTLRGNSTDATGTVAVTNTTLGGVGVGALTVAGGVSITEKLYVGANTIIESGAITSAAAMTVTAAVNNNVIFATTGTGVVTTSAPIIITNATNASSAVTGALIIAGGIGASGNNNFAGITTISNNTAGSAGAGALVVTGGASIGGDVYANTFFSNNFSSTASLTVTSAVNNNLVLATSGTGIVTSNSVVSLTNGTNATLSTTGALVVTGGIGVSGNNSFAGTTAMTNATASVSSTTGALVVSGGVGIGGDLYIGGALNTQSLALIGGVSSVSTTTGTLIVTGGVGISENLYIGGLTNIAGQLTVTNATASSSSSTGALVVTGGIGVSLASTFSGTVSHGGVVTITNATESSSISTGSLIVGGGVGIAKKLFLAGTFTNTNTTVSTSSVTGSAVFSGGVGIAGATYIAGLLVSENTTNSSGASTGSIVTPGGLGVAGNTFIGGVINAVSTTASTSVTTGSIVASGGVGIAGSMHIGGNIVLQALATVDGVDVSVLASRVSTLEGYPRGYGNVVLIDPVNGNDSTGVRGGLPFLSLPAGLAAALSGDVIFLCPGTYTITATIALGSGIKLIGFERHSSIIIWNTTTSATLLTMAANTHLERLTMQLNSSTANVSLIGIDLLGAAAVSAEINGVSLIINNSGGSGTGNITGILSAGTGTTTKNYGYTITDTLIECTSAGAGTKRGIILSTNNNLFVKNCEIIMTRVSGLGSYIAAETTNGVLQLEGCHCEGSDADISQTGGTIKLLTTVLFNATCNGINFTVLNFSSIFIFTDPGTIGTDTLRYFYPAGNVSTSIINYRVPRPAIIKNLIVNARVAPGTGNSSTVTIYKNGAATALAVTLANTTLTNTNSTNAISFTAGDTYAVAHTGAGGTNIADVVVQFEFY